MLSLLSWCLAFALATDPPPDNCSEPLAEGVRHGSEEQLVSDPRGKRPRELVEERLRKMGIGTVDAALGRRSFRGGATSPPPQTAPPPEDEKDAGGCSSDNAPPE